MIKSVLVFLFLLSSCLLASENWPQFRGVNALGVSENKGLPEKWSATENVVWKKEVPGRGWSSPVVWGKQIFITTVINEGQTEEPKQGLYFGGNRYRPPSGRHHWKVFCLNLDDGKLIWEKTAHTGIPKGPIHIKNSYASETPITDGERLYAYFGNQGLYCYSLEGEFLWKKQWPAYKTRYGWGLAASPVLHKGRLYIVNDNEEESFLVALDAKTGKQIWRVEREGEKSNWSTPYVWENKLRTEIITPGTRKNRSYGLDGKLLYEFGGNSSITIATPYASHGLLYVTSGYVGDRKKPIFAIRPGAKGDISLNSDEDTNKHIAWCQRRAGPYNPSTIVYGDLLYVLLDRGLVGCYEAKTGKLVYGPERIVPRGGAFTSSPWAYDGKVFFLDENGVTYVLKAGRKFELLATNRLDPKKDMCMATPAIAGKKLLIRTDSQIYCISREEKKPLEAKPKLGVIQLRKYKFEQAKKDMPYSLYVPKGYDKAKKYPLMVALHGLGSSHWQIIRYPGLTRLAEEHGYIVVAPMGYNSSGWYGSRGQSSRRSNPPNLGELSEKDVMNVLQIVRDEFSIDNKRIYLMGHSMGGGGTWHLGMKYPKIWAGLAPLAPAPPRNINDLVKIKDTPVIVVCGDRDGLVRAARMWVGRMKTLKMNYEYIEVKGGGHIRPAYQKLPEVYAFFEKHAKSIEK